MHRPATTRVLVTGAAGFIGHHLVSRLASYGYWVRGVDLANPPFEPTAAAEYFNLDLRCWDDCMGACADVDYVFALAANTGRPSTAGSARDITLVNTQTLEAARECRVRRFLYTSSSLVYRPGGQQINEADSEASDVGWDDLAMERLCRKYRKDYNLETRIARLHNVYGPLCCHADYSPLSPTGMCRRVALAPPGDTLEIAGNGQQLFSHTYISDCVDGLLRVMCTAYAGPVNLASSETVSLSDLAALVTQAASKGLRREHTALPQTSGRIPDAELSRERLSFEPQMPLAEGIRRTYRWIAHDLQREGLLPRARTAVA